MAIHRRFAKNGPPNRYVFNGGEVELYASTVALGIDGVFETPVAQVVDHFEDDAPAADDWIERGPIRELVINFEADEDTAAAGLVVEESNGGVTVDEDTLSVPVLANVNYSNVLELRAKYFRFRETNGGTAQTTHSLRVSGRR